MVSAFGFLEMIIVVGLVVVVALFVGAILLASLRILGGESTKQGRRVQSEETRMMQEIYHGLSKMEKRVEALETILLDRARAEDGKRTDL